MFFLDSPIGDIIYNIVHEIRNHPRLRTVLLAVASIVDGIFIIIYTLVKNRIIDIYWGNGSTSATNGFATDILLYIIIILSILLLLTVLSFSDMFEDKHSLSDELEKIAKRKQTLEEKIDSQQNGPYVQDIIQLNLSQLNEYYTINKTQSKHAYEFSIFMIFVGFLLIVTAVILGFAVPTKISITIITGIAGLLSEFIGATALNLYKESNKHVNDFIERLTYLQKVMLAIELVDRLSDDKKEDQYVNIISSLMIYEKQSKQ